MADQPTGPLTDAARTIGNAAGRVVAAVTGGPDHARETASAPPPKQKENVWAAEYVGSGTFIIHQPKRKARKRRQQQLHSPNHRMRK